MASSLSNHVNNISKGIHKIKCKFKHDDKKCETCRIKYNNKFEEKLKERSFNTYKFSNHKFILLFGKGVYPYECMNDWEKFNETS